MCAMMKRDSGDSQQEIRDGGDVHNGNEINSEQRSNSIDCSPVSISPAGGNLFSIISHSPPPVLIIENSGNVSVAPSSPGRTMLGQVDEADEEEMIFPITDIIEEEEHSKNRGKNKCRKKVGDGNGKDKSKHLLIDDTGDGNGAKNNHNLNNTQQQQVKHSNTLPDNTNSTSSGGRILSKPISIVAKIISSSDRRSQSSKKHQSDLSPTSSPPPEDSSSAENESKMVASSIYRESPSSGSNSAPKTGNGRALNQLNLNIRCVSPSTQSPSDENQVYHTVHGNNVTGSSPIYERFQWVKQQQQNGSRTRSHSGSGGGFNQQVRHSALISAGIRTNNNMPWRRQSFTPGHSVDDQPMLVGSLNNNNNHKGSHAHHRTSPNGSSSFFDSFRPRSTSDGKSCKRPSSVIAAIKNNFRNRHSQSSSSSSATVNTSTSTTATNGNQSPPPSPGATPISVIQHQPNSQSSQIHPVPSGPPVIDCQPNHQTGTVSAPISPNSVIDPFSVDYTLYATGLPPGEHFPPGAQQQSLANRPRSRSGSSTSAMAKVFGMIRGRANSIATEQPPPPQTVRQRLTFSHQESLCDRFEFEDIDENLVYVRFFKFYRCYDIIPISAKLVVFDTQLAVKKAFFALLSNGIRAAPLWDASRHQFIGMLTITDFIHILRTYYQSPTLKMENLEEHTLDIWRNMLKEKARPLVWVEPDESLFNAIKMLLHNKVHRLPVIDRDTGNVLYILTHKRILRFLFLFYYNRLPMPSYLDKSLRDLPQIGTHENVATGTLQMPLIEALNLMVERRISALPIVDKKNKVIDVYAKFDVIHLAADKMYQDLNITVKKALEFRNNSEGVVKCTLNESLHTIMERIVQAEVHRIIVVDNDDRVTGVISLSDLFNFLVLRPVSNMTSCCPTMAPGMAVSTLVAPTKPTLVEESGEENSSLNADDDDDEEEEECQLTVSSNSSERTRASSSSSLTNNEDAHNNNNNNNEDSTPPGSSTAAAKISMINSNAQAAAQTLTA